MNPRFAFRIHNVYRYEEVAGLEPPKLKEVGPFTMHNAKEKKTNITFFDNNTKVSYIATGGAAQVKPS
jgi:hypothetical protein